MDKFDRIFQLHSILANRRTPIDADSLIIATMKDHLNAPIEFDRDRGGFMYRRASGEETYELPGLWFSPAELQSLAVMQRIVSDLAQYYVDNGDVLPAGWQRGDGETARLRGIGDYIAGMTDRFAIARHEELVGPVSLPEKF